MSTAKRRVVNREVKLSAVRRLMAGESPLKIAEELQIGSSHLSKWWANYRRYGAEGLRPAHPPRNTKVEPMAVAAELGKAQAGMSGVERRVGHQVRVVDFF